MLSNNDNNAFVTPVYLGSISSDTTLPVMHLAQKSVLKSVKVMNGAAIAADDGNFVNLKLQNGSTVVAEFDSHAANEGALEANVAKDFTIVDGQETQDAGSDLKLVYDETEGTKETFSIEVPEDLVGDDLSSTGFTTGDDVASVDFWFDVDNAGDTEPVGVAAATRGIQIDTIVADDTAEEVAAKLVTAIDADAKFVATIDPDNARKLLVTASILGVRANVADGLTTEATGFTFTTVLQGAAVVAKALTNAQLIVEHYPL